MMDEYTRIRSADELDDNGCLYLVGAVLRIAAKDWRRSMLSLSKKGAGPLETNYDIKDVEHFFRSGYFNEISCGLNGEKILEDLKKEGPEGWRKALYARGEEE